MDVERCVNEIALWVAESIDSKNISANLEKELAAKDKKIAKQIEGKDTNLKKEMKAREKK